MSPKLLPAATTGHRIAQTLVVSDDWNSVLNEGSIFRTEAQCPPFDRSFSTRPLAMSDGRYLSIVGCAGQGVFLHPQQMSPLSVNGSLLIALDPGDAEEIDGIMNRVPFAFATARPTESNV